MSRNTKQVLIDKTAVDVASSKARRLVTCKTAEELSSIKAVTWRKWIGERRVTSVKMGRAVRIPVSEIERIIAEGTIPARRTA